MRKNLATHDIEAAADFIEMFEGFKETAYRCPAGVLTIGFGHTDGVKEGDTITYDEAHDLLREDTKKVAVSLARWINVPVTEGQFVALTSLAYNIGVYGVVHQCTKLMRAVNSEDWDEAAHQFLDVNKVDGKEVPGLTRRRQAEAKLFLGEA